MMIILEEEDVSSIVNTLRLPKVMESKLKLGHLTFTNKSLGVPDLEVVGVYEQRKQSWLHKLLRYYTYDLVGLKTPLRYILLSAKSDTFTLREACKFAEDSEPLDITKFRFFNLRSVEELVNEIRL